MKIASWNVNGVRAVFRVHFYPWLKEVNPDFICIQETKARPEQLEETLLHPLGYYSYWHSAQKAGYSGVGIYSKKEILTVQVGLGVPEIDAEGRVLIAETPQFILVNAYFPNSQRDHARLGYKLEFCEKILEYCNRVTAQGRDVVICGDFNIAHRAIDLKNPKSNENNAGFLPEERSWFNQLMQQGYIDAFREFESGPGHYTWWSYRPGVREKNVGWRLDYFVVNQAMTHRLVQVDHQIKVRGSDHCPILLELKD